MLKQAGLFDEKKICSKIDTMLRRIFFHRFLPGLAEGTKFRGGATETDNSEIWGAIVIQL